MAENDGMDGFPTDRIKTLTDGIFAIVMTLLVLELHVPEIDGDSIGPALWDALVHLWPNIAAFILTFGILGVYWVGHHNFFHFVKRVDRAMLWINLLFFLLISLLPFSADLLAHYPFEPVAISVYGLHLVAIGILLSVGWKYATHHHHLVDPKMSHAMMDLVQIHIAKAPVVYFVAVLLSWISPLIGMLLILLVPLYYIFPNLLDRFLPGRKEHHHESDHDHS